MGAVIVISIYAKGTRVKNRPPLIKNMRMMRGLCGFLAVSLLTVLLPMQSAWAWSQDPHRLVCEIAWLELKPEERKALAVRVEASGHSRFSDSCLWADQVRQTPRYRFSSPLHYMNVPRANRHLGEAAACRKCVIEAIREMRKLASGQVSAVYQTSPEEALLMVAHLVADVHQPLHVGYADDKGGNEVALVLRKGKWNLHSLWDKAIPRRVTGRDWQATARRWQAEISDEQRREWALGDEIAWAEESFQLTRQIYQALPEDRRVTDDWMNHCNEIVRLQLLKAGVRLSQVLRDLLRHPV